MCTPQTILAVLELSPSCTPKNLYDCSRVGWTFSLENYILLTGSVLKKEHTEERAYSQKSCLRVFFSAPEQDQMMVPLLGDQVKHWRALGDHLAGNYSGGMVMCAPGKLANAREGPLHWSRLPGGLGSLSDSWGEARWSASPWFPLPPPLAYPSDLHVFILPNSQGSRSLPQASRGTVNQRARQGTCP